MLPLSTGAPLPLAPFHDTSYGHSRKYHFHPEGRQCAATRSTAGSAPIQSARCAAHYNFIRPHRALKFGREMLTPAMQAGLVSRPLTFRDIFTAVAGMFLLVLILIDLRSPDSAADPRRLAA